MSTEFRSVLDDRSSRLISHVHADNITRQRSRSRGRGDNDDDEEIIVSRVEQPYRTSSSAVTAPYRIKKSEHMRNISPAPVARKSKKGKGKKKKNREARAKHVTYDEKVTVRHSDTEESIVTNLSGKDSERGSSPRVSSVEYIQDGHAANVQQVLEENGEEQIHGDDADRAYSDQIRLASQQIVQPGLRSAPDGAQMSLQQTNPPRYRGSQNDDSRDSAVISQSHEVSQLSPRRSNAKYQEVSPISHNGFHEHPARVVTRRPPSGRKAPSLSEGNITADMSSPGKGDSGFYTENEQSRSRINIKKDYVYDRTISYRAAIEAQYSDEIRRLAEQNFQEIVPDVSSSGNRSRTKQSNVLPERSGSNAMPSRDLARDLSGSQRSVSSSISNFLRKFSPSLPRHKKGPYNGSAQSLDSGSYHSDASENPFRLGQRARTSLMKLVGRGQQRSQSNDPLGGDSNFDSNRNLDTDSDRRFPDNTARILKSIEQNSATDKTVYQRFKDKPAAAQPFKPTAMRISPDMHEQTKSTEISPLPANKENRDNSVMTFNEASLIASTPYKDESNKVNVPQSLNIRPVSNRRFQAIQSLVARRGSGDESIGECSLDVNMEGFDASTSNLQSSSVSKQVVLSQENLGQGQDSSSQLAYQHNIRDTNSLTQPNKSLGTSRSSEHNLHHQTDRILPRTLQTSNESDASISRSSQQSPAPLQSKEAAMPVMVDKVDYTEEEFSSASPHVPSYLKVSCAVSGYGRYSAYSSYGVDKRSISSPALSFRSSCESGRRVTHTSNTSPTSATQAPDAALRNGDCTESGHLTRFPTGNCELDGNYFLNLAKVEGDRLQCLCDRAERDISSETVPEDACGKMRAAMGKTQLLLTRKLRQFCELCDRHKRPSSDGPLTTWEDLQGFWDMVHIQIDDVDDLFREIEIMRENQWSDISPLSLPLTNSAGSSPKSASVSSRSTTPSQTPKHTPSSRRRGLKPNSSADSLSDQSTKAKAMAKSRDDARKKMLAEKRANMKSSKGSLDREVLIYVADTDGSTAV